MEMVALLKDAEAAKMQVSTKNEMRSISVNTAVFSTLFAAMR